MRLRVCVTIVFCGLLIISSAQTTDSLESVLKEKEGFDRIPVLHELILSVWLNYPEQGMKYGEEALELSKDQEDSTNISKTLRLIAGVYYYKGDYSVSLDYNLEALEIARALNDSLLINSGYNNIGLLYYNLGSYPTALEYLLQSYRIKVKLNEDYARPTVLNNIGLVYEKVYELEEARSYFKDALNEAIRQQDQDQIIYSNNNLAFTYLKEEKFDTALLHFGRARNLAVKINNINWGATSLRGIGEVYQKQWQLDTALSLYERSLVESKEIGDKKGIAEAFYLISGLLLDDGKYNESLQYLDSAQNLVISLQYRQLLIDIINRYIAIYKKADNVDKIIAYQQEYINLRDSLFKDVVDRNLTLVPLKIKEQQDRIKLSEQQSQIEQSKIRSRLFLVLIIVLLPLLAIMVFLLRKIRTVNVKISSRNYEITRQNEEIAFQKQEIQKKNDRLIHSIDQLKRTQGLLVESEKMASIGQLVAGLAHELNNPLNIIGGIIRPMEMNIEEIKEKTRDAEGLSETFTDMKSLLKGVKESTQKASNLIEKLKTLSPQVRTHDVEEFDLSDCLNETIELVKKNHSEVHISKEIKENISIRSNYYELTKIFFNILTNACESVEHSPDLERLVTVHLNENQKNFEITISDNGVGIEKDHLQSIFEPFFTTKQEFNSSGLGLFVAYSLAQRNNATIKVESEPNKGSKFTIVIEKQ